MKQLYGHLEGCVKVAQEPQLLGSDQAYTCVRYVLYIACLKLLFTKLSNFIFLYSGVTTHMNSS